MCLFVIFFAFFCLFVEMVGLVLTLYSKHRQFLVLVFCFLFLGCLSFSICFHHKQLYKRKQKTQKLKPTKTQKNSSKTPEKKKKT